ncbi:hypothetical protein HRW07_30545 [Streptomyces lunaelactis]|uniref:hypothetical protein n=1 Tax=Streptomyces lunaelactis TaxID=1535768 RepID=UPI001584AC88|nr:hypothetical protein [Streptomyces lunaelactis]NUL07481.1 hypothetical protein [Streptomyces lunaelactis]
MLNVQELLDLRLGKLKSAIEDWEVVVRRLSSLAIGQGDEVNAAHLKAKAQKADWSGVNATVSKDFVTRTASEFNDAVTAARSIHAVLRDSHSAFTRHQDEMAGVVADAAKRNIYINSKGGAQPPSAPPAVAGEGGKDNRPSDEELAAAERDVSRILREADESDRIAARALRALASDKHDFTSTLVDGLNDADYRQGEADAKYWAKEIAKGKVADWSDEKLKRFNETLAVHRDNPGFSEKLATDLGADGTLRFWRDLAAPPGFQFGPLDDERAKVLAQVQDNLGMTLANATNVDSPAMDAWKKDMIAAGGSRVAPDAVMGATPYGFSVMSSLMRKGKFDSEFLQDYGREMLEFERRHWDTPATLWHDSAPLNYPPSEEANDPVGGFLEALGHNPKASLEFFQSGRDAESNWDYLVGNDDGSRNWRLSAGLGPGVGSPPLSQENLGHALESAAIGLPYDSDGPSKPHSAGSAALVNRLVEYYGSNPEFLDKSPLNASLGNITAEYMRDVQDGMNGASVIKTYGSNAELGSLHRDGILQNFLGAVGKDPDAYGAIINAQQAVTTELVSDTFHSRGRFEEVSPEVGNQVRPGAEIAGIMAESRTQAVYDDKLASDEEFNEGVMTADKWVGRVLDMVPVAGDVVGWVSEDVRESVVDRYTRDSSEAAAEERNTFLKTQRIGSADAAYDATYTAAREAGYDHDNADSKAGSARREVLDGYGLGQQETRERDQ